MIYLTRRASFSASHYYWNPDWSEERNGAVFGRCANRNGHGHNYTLEVTVAGEVDAVTGFVVDLKWLKDLIEREVLEAWDHRHLNLETPDFARTIPTTENIAVAAWQRLERGMAASGARLSRVIIDSGVRIPEGLVVGENPVEDARRFRRTENGVCLINQRMIAQLEAELAAAKAAAAPAA